MNKNIRFALSMLVSLFAISANGAPVVVAYSVNSDSGSSDQDSLYEINLTTGIETNKGALRTGILDDTRSDTEGLAFSPDGTLWGVDDESRTLFKINMAGIVEIPDAPLANFPIQPNEFGGNDFGLTFSCENTLYIVSVQTRTLHNLKLDGSSEIIGVEGALGANISAIAAIGNPTRLYGLGNGLFQDGTTDSPYLYRIDVTTGVASKIGALGMGTTIGNYNQGGLAFDGDGVLWAITDRRGINNSINGLPSEILRIDVNTGTAALVHTTTEVGFESLAIYPPAGCGTNFEADDETDDETPRIPTLNPAGRLLAIFVLMLAGMIFLRRRIS